MRNLGILIVFHINRWYNVIVHSKFSYRLKLIFFIFISLYDK